jgi:formimidoylglutamate deiminase
LRHEFFFDYALLPSGWTRDVRVSVADGTVIAVAEGGTRAGAEYFAGIAIPGLPNLHSHAFQRGMAGLAERRGLLVWENSITCITTSTDGHSQI